MVKSKSPLLCPSSSQMCSKEKLRKQVQVNEDSHGKEVVSLEKVSVGFLTTECDRKHFPFLLTLKVITLYPF